MATQKKTSNQCRALVAAALAVLCLVTFFAQRGADGVRVERADELVYLPNEKLLNHFTAGMSSVVADLLWLRCVQFTAVTVKGGHNFAWLNQMLNTIVRMDPYFADVYRYGGIFLASIKADDDGGLELLQRGIVARPDVWEIPYEAAMIYLLNRREEPESRRLAAHYLGMAASTGKAPKLVTELAASLQGEYNLDEIEGDMWASLQRSGDRFLEELAERKQQELGIRKNLRTLNDNIARFRAETGRAPESLDALLDAGYFGEQHRGNRALLQDPLGGRYFLGPGGEALNTSLLDNAMNKELERMRGGLKRYQEVEGGWPRHLDELVDKGYIAKIPAHPHPGRNWTYSPESGEVGG